ncbi:MAG: aminomethyl-transferring glycine dehydrogenase subunit GcvPA [Elusimicrobia bacterium]|jgi:glycine dehydrogenase subunit 1|nr:aminomethyl-transferring glycine dehydrogenase subunit GcvPA [Elusimicrobiota bacterium]MBK7544414.1 aminomethyl-transferring glycine dehydrogenase subunit GcvPA [Elusimicrobiota bacterium]MBK7573936.1 aminomethyl-transferring glycine dehydrogenase subunit GcvPA [Elusimicrobiota bacterium]MBK8127228.1 aminomethyl-transferring glycine dehydrogenase subunit GcvPA [Elusimicrobiota bacterium]MBK9058259.1 aminomethyl-transferring glycine dehydrogenase subunit GcvPA [Elusimicrobiota bacterium]
MFVAHTPDQKKAMLAAAGVASFDELIAGLPRELVRPPLRLPGSLSEMELVRHMEELAARDHLAHSYLGAGAYEHFVPTAVWALALRGEFATAYTPYQAEASQGTLQSIFEFQSLVAELFKMDVANASMYDGASAAAEACLVAAKHTGRAEVLVPDTVHPQTRRVIETYLAHSGARVVRVPTPTGVLEPAVLAKHLGPQTAALLVQTPNFFGNLEIHVAELSDQIHKAGGLLIASAYPVSLGLLTPPGDYGADIAVAEGQPLGLPLAYGGPYLGLFACRNELIRKMPGRVVGQTVDKDGRRAFVLTLQAREQHIRREKATSNICTNQALCALASTIYLSLVGKSGFQKLAELNFQKAHYAREVLAKRGFAPVFDHPFFNEFTVRCPAPPEKIIEKLAVKRVLAGHALGYYHPDRKDQLLVCVTELKTKADIDQFGELMAEAAR